MVAVGLNYIFMSSHRLSSTPLEGLSHLPFLVFVGGRFVCKSYLVCGCAKSKNGVALPREFSW